MTKGNNFNLFRNCFCMLKIIVTKNLIMNPLSLSKVLLSECSKVYGWGRCIWFTLLWINGCNVLYLCSFRLMVKLMVLRVKNNNYK